MTIIASLECKTSTILTLKCTSHGYMYCQNSDCCSQDYLPVLKKFVRVVSEIYKKALKVQILNKVTLRQVVRKRVSV